MAAQSLHKIVTHLRHLALQRGGDDVTDGQLLGQFIRHHDERAFETLVKRHGSMVMGVCRRVLCNAHDADDAFQATFLILVHKAALLKSCELVGNWLYGVAYRTALAARSASARRRSREKQVIDMPQPAMKQPDDWSELRPLLDQELNELAASFREAVVLCDLEGQTRKEAARKLGIPESTLSGRLTTARRQLAKRLTRRGLTLSSGALATLLSQDAASAFAPKLLVVATVKAASTLAAGSGAAGLISTRVVALTQGVIQAMYMTRLKTLSALVLAFCLAAGALALACSYLEAKPVLPAQPQDKKADEKKAAPEPAKVAGTYKAIVALGSGNVVIAQTGKESVASDDANASSRVENGILYLQGSSNFRVEVINLPRLELNGSGNVQARGLSGNRLELVIAGSGNLEATGAVVEQDITISGSGEFKGPALTGQKANVISSGSGKALVNVAAMLRVTSSGSGDVEYLGMPNVMSEITGSGVVRQAALAKD